jgi:hypothetical protein
MTYELTYKGPGFSLNDAYVMHWSKRKKKKDALYLVFKALIREAQIPFLPAFTLAIRYNSRHDCDNVVALAKCMVDQMRKSGRILDDAKDIYRGISITPDHTLPASTYVFTVRVAEAATKRRRKGCKKKEG